MEQIADVMRDVYQWLVLDPSTGWVRLLVGGVFIWGALIFGAKMLDVYADSLEDKHRRK